MDTEWLTTGQAASMLGTSRQHVVDLCNRGELPCTRSGSHRRIRRQDAQHLLHPELSREQEKSLWLHRAVLGRLMVEPTDVLDTARQNIHDWKPGHRSDGMSAHYLDVWEQIVDAGVDAVVPVLTGEDQASSDLRQNSPFAGVLPDVERRQVLRSFRRHWDQEHEAA
jgi:excisionase family DNA binding protein